ncbi:MAG: tRNA (N6-isopentenyl adenosine(37)-C2)-methylthiotransferase MiaB [Candidatus Omnitrophota bacterium]|nr:MAG: tRNA (N6-isopentenyl adenosine(37)-C2)-methylthiotransferase MiaB [Candidatus Omnitrophota bacterium]
MKEDKKKVFIKNFGCQMNEADSELVYSMLLAQGYQKANSYKDADVILFNTCSVRKHAEDRVWGKVGELKKLKENVTVPIFAGGSAKAKTGRPHFPIIGIIGCMARAQKGRIFERLPHVNFICGPSNIYEVGDLIEQVLEDPEGHFSAIGKRKRPVKKGTVPIFAKTSTKAKLGQSPFYREEKIRAWVNISYGCDNFCSYCIVPYVRGRETSRKSEDIIDEIKMLVDDGVKEVTLLGQNINSYGQSSAVGHQSSDFVKLLEEINKIPILLRIRFMTSHPKDASIDLFKAMRDLDKVCEHLHLPFQSGSDRILKLMNRKYTANNYLKLIEQYRKIVNGGSVTTDVIVGFPTETEEDFYKTYMLMKEGKFDSAFIFKYSPRPYTAAYKMKDDIKKEAKEERNQSLLRLQDRIKKKRNKLLINTIQQALGTKKAKRGPISYYCENGKYYLNGRTRTNMQVIYEGNPELIGHLSDVKIKDIEENTLIGKRV